MNAFQRVAFTARVLAAQAQAYGHAYASGPADGEVEPDPLGPDERAFVEARDSFYLASISESGWPFVQHRGGPPGFLKALDEHRLGFADVRGNRQLVTVSNLALNDRVALILMDYPARLRLKILAHAKVLDPAEQPDLLRILAPSGRPHHVERLMLLQVVGFDWNCPQHITPRFTLAELEAMKDDEGAS